MGGKKFDGDKPTLQYVPPNAYLEVGKVMGFGAKKYGAFNYMEGMDWTRLIGAAERHINAFKRDIDIDDESGLPHLAHAIASLMMLLEYTITDRGTDDRFKVNRCGHEKV